MHNFFHDLESITNEILELAITVEGSVRDALQALEERRLELTREVIDSDGLLMPGKSGLKRNASGFWSSGLRWPETCVVSSPY